MMDDKFKKGIADLKSIELSGDEKAHILQSVLESPEVSPYAPKRSFWMLLRSEYHMAAVILLLLVGGGAITYSAEGSLPGEKLYFVKVGLNEPIRDFINITPENQAEWESVKAVRRLDEAADLVIQGKLDEKIRNDLESRFNKHVDAFASSVEEVASSTPKTDLIELEFEANISARTKILGQLDQDKEDARKPVTEIKKTEQQDQEITGKDNEREDKEKQRAELKKLEKAVYDKLKERKDSERQKTEKKERDLRD